MRSTFKLPPARLGFTRPQTNFNGLFKILELYEAVWTPDRDGVAELKDAMDGNASSC